ncbi:MAG TPA: hypothetical protein VLM83_02440 [Anaerolineales bacterium]|nr:hypothetical protein [Anaerolineales bacterium]
MTKLIIYSLCFCCMVLCDLNGGGDHFRIYDDHRHLVGHGEISEFSDTHDHADDFIAIQLHSPTPRAVAPGGYEPSLLPAGLLALVPLLPPPKAA